ncbi:MAG: energy transducer TonB, partial [Muribaculaceae bacterium]|nr:energy transducer TonB [Muribaculaceae bacterium]
TDGTIGAIKIDNMIDPDLEQEAFRIVKSMPKWTPADKPTTVTLPIKFTLED